MNIEKLSGWILKGLMAVTVIVFALFMLVGFDTPYEENPKMNAPLLTDAVIILSIVLVIAAACVTIWSAFMQFKTGNTTSKDEGIAGKTGLFATLAFVASIVIGIIVGVANSGEHLLINGKDWNNPTDIILTDTSMISIAILTVLSVAAVIYSMVAQNKKK
jgi:cytochrome bd-type quinol oxidase subunit 2